VLRVATCAIAGAATVGLAAALHDHGAAPRRRRLARLRDHRVPRAPGAADFAIARGQDAAELVRRAVEALGGMAAFVRRGERVVIKPNVAWNRLPEQAANTNPEVVKALVRLCLGAGAATVWVTDNPVNTADRCFDRSGIQKAAAEAGARVVLPDRTSFREVEVGGRLLRVADVLYPLLEADRVINVPIVKQHGLCGATLAMKNWYGVIGGQRVRLHQEIHRSIVELAQMVRPTLTILDATRVLVANGPTGGNLADVKRLDTIAASGDEVALDAFGASLLGLEPTAVGSIALGEQAGLGRADYKSLKLVEVAL
jgi:uncharacterized protein (DUF362 family)